MVPNLIRRRSVRWLLPAFVVLLPVAGCQCSDEVPAGPWNLQGSDALGADVEPTPEDTDVDRPEDTADIPIDTWQPEDVVSDVECENALDDRTSLIVDRAGTTWVGFHKYRSGNCEGRPTLVVARKPVGGTWVEEDIQPHAGIFGINSLEPGEPVMVYPDARNPRRTEQTGSGTFRAAHRRGSRDWRVRELDIGDQIVEPGDGFDVTEDGESYWATFAKDNGQMVRLYQYDTTGANPEWEGRNPLGIADPRPAVARGLRAGPDEGVYLVFREDSNADPPPPFGVAKYDKSIDRWTGRALLEDVDRRTRSHSLVLKDEGRDDICLANRNLLAEYLLVTCGTMSDLDRDQQHFRTERIPEWRPASITEGRDGTLYVAFHPPSEDELRLAKREPGESWTTQTIYERAASGVSTAIDQSGDLVLAFYTRTDSGRYALKVLRERPDQL